MEELRSQTFSFDAKIKALQDILDDFRVGNEKEEVINRLLASFSGKDSGAFIARLQSDRKLLNGLLASEPKRNILGKIVTKVVKLLGDEDGNGSVNISYGGKMALIVGLGYEVGITIDSNGDFSPYVSGSIGVGIQTPTAKENLSLAQLIRKSNDRGGSISMDEPSKGVSSSTTVDIGAGVVVTYDLDNLDDSGVPNSYGYGGVGGGVWKTWTWNF